ncbi:MAG: UDP-N-acetylmuramoylalanyl-D-glutamyl-2, 6-diaminopimelate--D-alanyl-D-alanine ligase, partial [Pseudomonadota bacterium]
LADQLGKETTGSLGIPGGFTHCEGPAEAIAALEQFDLTHGDAILVKGSNSVGLGRLVSHFTSASE